MNQSSDQLVARKLIMPDLLFSIPLLSDKHQKIQPLINMI